MEDWTRLGEAVVRRRSYLGFTTRQQFADGTGFPAKTLSDLEKHRRDNFDRSTYGRLERALQWPNGAIESILAGGPVPFEVYIPDPAGRVAALKAAVADAFPTAGDLVTGGSVARSAAGEDPRDLDVIVALSDPDPLEAKLERLQLLAGGLNPSDLRRLNANIQTQIDWALTRAGRPEPTDEELRQVEQLQRAANAHNQATREHQRTSGPGPAGTDR